MKKNYDDIIQLLYENYSNINKMMIKEMKLSSSHGGLTGNYRETVWMKFFKDIFPKKFSLEQGVIIIDSQGNISKEVDIAVFDEQFTPYLFKYGELKFIPIEAVAAVIECKSTKLDVDSLKEWVKSIDKLETRNSGIARMATGFSLGFTQKTQERTRPIKILTSMLDVKYKSKRIEILSEYFDFILYLKKLEIKDKTTDIDEYGKEFVLKVKNEEKMLGWWADQLNKYKSTETSSEELNINHLSEKDKPENYKELEIKEFKIENKLSDQLNKHKPTETSIEELEITLLSEKDKPEKNKKFKIENKLSDLKIMGNPILTLKFQLNQLLMLLNNPMLFPHFAYAKVFQNMVETRMNKINIKE